MSTKKLKGYNERLFFAQVLRKNESLFKAIQSRIKPKRIVNKFKIEK